ncbi:MAG: RES family NAD+ phosphorylase [Nitratireductor sp.]
MKRLYRIASSLYPVFDGMGAFLNGARWNSSGSRVIYCAENLSCARLEQLVHIGRIVSRPLNQVYIEISVPGYVSVTQIGEDELPVGWDHPTDLTIAQQIGDSWIADGKTLLLNVPSVASRGDRVIVINQAHREFSMLAASPEMPLQWDTRLFP